MVYIFFFKLLKSLLKIVVDAVLTIHEEGKPIDLFMVEVMEMLHKTETDTKYVPFIRLIIKLILIINQF